MEIFKKSYATCTAARVNDSKCISSTENAQAQVAYEKFHTPCEISMIGENLALRNFSNMELHSIMPANTYVNLPNPRHLKEDDTPSLLEAKIHVLCGNFVCIGKNFQLRNFLQVDPGCTGSTYDPSNQLFWNVVFRYNILHLPIVKIPPLCVKLMIIS
jgi:hypothetical protein